MADHIGTGFTKWQYEALRALLLNQPLLAPPAAPTSDLLADLPSALIPTPLSAPPLALQPCTSAAPCELPLQPIPTPVPARSYSAPSVETMKEVEHPLRNIALMKKKLGASNIPASRLLFNEIYIGWPTKFGGSNMCFSRDEDLDAWYTTMLNTHAKKLATRALPNPAQRHAARRHHFFAIRYRPVLTISRVQILSTFFDFLTLLLSNGSYLTFYSLNLYRPSLVARYALFDAPEPLITSVLCGCCRLPSLSPNPNFKEQVLALRSSAFPVTPQYCTCSYSPPPLTPPTSCSFQRSMVGRIRDMIQDVIWIAQW